MRGATAILLASGLTILTATPASADGAQTSGGVTHDVTVTFTSAFPCGGELYEITLAETFVLHTTTKDGSLHQSGTGAGTFSAVPADGTGTSYAGHFAFRFGPQFTGSTVVSTSVFHFSAAGDDGSRLDQLRLGHLTFTHEANGVAFFKFVC